MDTRWNNTEGEREYYAAPLKEDGAPAGAPRPGRRAGALAGFLAFFLGASLVLSSLGAMGDRIAWQRDPSPRWERDWQETDAFRAEVSSLLREFLTIGAGGRLDAYSYGPWLGYGDVVTAQEEAYRAWWGFYPYTEAVAVGRGMAAEPSESVPEFEEDSGEPDKVREPDAAYRNDKNVLYYIRNGAEGSEDHKVFCNAGDRQSQLLARSLEGYNFYLQFLNGKVSILKDGQELDVYGNGYYDGDSQWFVPGYQNFPAAEQLSGVRVVLAVRETPVRYYNVDYQNGGTYYNNTFYSIAQVVEDSRTFYRTQAALLGAGLACLVLGLFLRKSAEPLRRKIAAWTHPVWTEARFLLVGACACWAFLPGLANLDLVYELLYGCGWGGGYALSDWGMAILRLATMNLPGTLTLFWLCWLIRNDHKYNPREVRRSLLRPFFRALRGRDLKRPIERRLSRRTALLISAAWLLAAEVLGTLINLTLIGVAPAWLIWTVYLIPVLLAALALALFQRCQGGLARDLGRLADQVEAVRAGDLERPLELPEDADLRRTAESLNDIQAGMRAALEEQTRSERMKVELVSNVSHDLKTPLTSILSYAELLRQEDLPPAAADYANIIDGKAKRLKTMVEDVFEISKAAADQLPVHLERLDLAKLLRQTLADMDGPIQKSALTFRADLPEEPVMITADGKRLYRVFQNLIDNALRYALEGSRVYLELKTAEGTEAAGLAQASIRNTSRTELSEGVDFAARFVRGDESRTDGGSGLGLSIAKSFTEACGGSFRVETVADLFTVIVTFPLEGDA